jgi:glutathione synthase/RimK-type ligase-like ATP-grasp enzyme
MGGRAEDIFLIKNKNDLKNKLDDRLSNNNPYKAGYIVQEFVKSTLDHDYRISIINDKVVFTNTRSLIPTDSEIKWLASASQGSKVEKIEAPYEIADIALKTNKTIEAFMNEIDIIVTEKGPCIIENNPTPNFNPKSETRRAMLALTLNEIKKILK